MDAHPGILHWSDGQAVRPRIQSYDSTFTVKKTQSMTLHKKDHSVNIEIRPPVPTP